MQKICTTCGHVGPPAVCTRGSIFIEIILWLCLIVPGVIYSIWRMGSRYETCAACGNTGIIPLDSPMAKKLAADTGVDLVAINKKTMSHKLGYMVGRWLRS